MTEIKLKRNWDKYKTEDRERVEDRLAVPRPRTEAVDRFTRVTWAELIQEVKDDIIPLLPVIWSVAPESII